MKFSYLLPLLLLFSSCSLFSKYRKENFTYRKEGQQITKQVLVPKGYRKHDQETDSLGNTISTYSYGGDKIYYLAYLADTTKMLQPIDYSRHVPREDGYGGVSFKGTDEGSYFWRELRRQRFRIGYRAAEAGKVEGRFDSSTNYSMRSLFTMLK